MADDIQRIESMITILRDMKKDVAKVRRSSEFDLTQMTPKQIQKRNADAEWIGMANIKRRHELHALSVELGFSDRRQSYEPIELTDGWHRYKFQPREPFTG